MLLYPGKDRVAHACDVTDAKSYAASTHKLLTLVVEVVKNKTAAIIKHVALL
jgi:hypothetical protein